MPKFLYTFWGFLSDKKGVSSPDGNSTYSIWIIDEMIKRGWEVCCAVDRDKPLVEKDGIEAFAAFSKFKRWSIYNKINFISIDSIKNTKFDLILHEWRMPTKDNVLPIGDINRTPDMDIQNLVIENSLKTNTKLIIFDLDYQFTEEDELKCKPWKVLEQGLKPKNNHTTIFIPFNKEELKQFPTQIPYYSNELSYIGNFYNRENDFNTKIIPYAKKHANKVHLIGNYMKDSLKEFRENNKEIVFHDRIGFDKFLELYSKSICVPLLATEEYKEHGHMTARIIESILFGSIPIGFSDFYGISLWLPNELIVNMDNYENSMDEVVWYVKNLGFCDRLVLRQSLIDKIGKTHDVKNFVDIMLGEKE